MSKETNKLIPELRFPEFVNGGEWREKSFEELFIIGNGRDYKHLEKGEIPVYGSGGYMVSVDDYLYDGESVCIGRKGTIDKPMFLKGKFWTVDTLFYTHSFKDCLPKYIHYVFQNIDWLKHNEAGGVPSLSKTNIYKIKTLVPSPTEQQKIADCLSSLDELITAHTDKLETLKTYKKGLMQNLFPQEGEKVPRLRFQEFEKDGEWNEKKIKNVFSIFQGFAFSSEDNVPNGVRWLKIADVGIQQMKAENATFLPFNYKEEYEKFLVKKGDYVLALTRPILNLELKIAPIDETFHNALLNQRVGKIISSNCISFIYYLLHTKKMVTNINNNIAGNEPPNLSFQQIENILINIPANFAEQKKIAETLSSLDDLIKEQAIKIEQLKSHKKGLMHGLFPKIT